MDALTKVLGKLGYYELVGFVLFLNKRKLPPDDENINYYLITKTDRITKGPSFEEIEEKYKIGGA